MFEICECETTAQLDKYNKLYFKIKNMSQPSIRLSGIKYLENVDKLKYPLSSSTTRLACILWHSEKSANILWHAVKNLASQKLCTYIAVCHFYTVIDHVSCLQSAHF